MTTPTKPIGVRLEERDLKILDEIIQQLASRNPDWKPTRSDAIRHVIASSGGVAMPVATAITKPSRRNEAA